MSESFRERLIDVTKVAIEDAGFDFVDRDAAEYIFEAVRDALSPAAVLPDPKGGCVCTPHTQNAGGGYTEHLLEYEPACPEHSQHLYDPRLGEWIHRPDTQETR